MEKSNDSLEETRKYVNEVLEQRQLVECYDENAFLEVYFGFSHRYPSRYGLALFITDSLICLENFRMYGKASL